MKNRLDWKAIDDRLFVNLVADFLQEKGFSNIQIQGDGPDGGVDLFATQTTSLGFQEHHLRWAIQCKYSASGQSKSVNDSEIRDVEGILRSERFLSQKIGGYILITNRRIAQNVVERLRGINTNSPYRTSYIDGNQLELFLIEHKSLTERYFIHLSQFASTLGASSFNLLDKNWGRTGPTIPVLLACDYTKTGGIYTTAMVDTGAQITVGPRQLIEALSPREYTTIKIATNSSTSLKVPVYRLFLSINSKNISENQIFSGEIECVALDNVHTILLGRDVLKHLTLLLDGPTDVLRIWGKK